MLRILANKGRALVLSGFALAGCTHMDMQTAQQTLRDQSELSITRFRDENAGGMDTTTIVVSRWDPRCNCSRVLDISHSFQEGGMRTLFHGAGTVAIGATGFAVGEALRRPDESSISVSSGNSSASGGAADASGGNSNASSTSAAASKSESLSHSSSSSSNTNTSVNKNYNGNSIDVDAGGSKGKHYKHHKH